jgi:hypothetical protein
MELFIFSGLLATFGLSAAWATRPNRPVELAAMRRAGATSGR